MKIDYILSAETCTFDKDNSAHALKIGLDTISSASFPAVIQQFSIMFKAVYEEAELGKEFVYYCSIIGPNGNKVRDDLRISHTPMKHQPSPFRLVGLHGMFRYNGLILFEEGMYKFVITNNGDNLGSVTVWVKKEEKK